MTFVDIWTEAKWKWKSSGSQLWWQELDPSIDQSQLQDGNHNLRSDSSDSSDSTKQVD
jgi:hypothetical protein